MLAIILVDYNLTMSEKPNGGPIRLLDEALLNGTILLILVSCPAIPKQLKQEPAPPLPMRLVGYVGIFIRTYAKDISRSGRRGLVAWHCDRCGFNHCDHCGKEARGCFA
jgi:hypothetical protein